MLTFALLTAAALAQTSAPLPSTTPCPDRPNCVSSRAPDTDLVHAIAPLPLPSTGFDAVVAAAASMPRATVTETGEGWAVIVYTTALLRFKDDLSLELDGETGVVHVRSASRVGYGDLGVNRARVEALRALVAEERAK